MTEEHDDVTDAPALDEATVAAHLERLGAAIAALDDETVRSAVAALPETSRTELATNLQLPRATMSLGTALSPLLRRKASVAQPQRRLSVAFTLTEPVNDDTVHALGDRHEDPSRDDLLAVLPPIVERHGPPLVTLMLAAYAASDAPCRAVMAELLETDERFVIGEPVPNDTPAVANGAGAATAVDEKEREAKREERKAAKAARKEAQQKARHAQEQAHAARRAAQRSAKRSG